MKKVLIIHSIANVRELLAERLAADGYLVVPIGRPDLAQEVMRTLGPDLVVIDSQATEKDKRDVFAEAKRQYPYLRVLMLAANDDSPGDFCDSLASVYVIRSLGFNGLRQKISSLLQPKGRNSIEPKRSRTSQI